MAQSVDSLEEILVRRRWTRQQARTVLAAAASSGVSLAQFAARHGVQAQRLSVWRRTFARDTPAQPASAPSFVEVPVGRGVAPRAGTRYELVLVSGAALRIEGAFDPATVRTLLGLLHTARAC